MLKTNRKIILAFIFTAFLVVGFGFGHVEKASAKIWCSYSVAADSEDYSSTKTFKYTTVEVENATACTDICKNDTSNWDCTPASSEAEADKTGYANKNASNNTPDVCPNSSIFSPTTWINCLLLYILQFEGLLLSAASILFQKVIDVSVFNTILRNNSVIYEMWGFVRDILNVAFILVLLFSAFCTVFQIQKFSYKNILLQLILMALLVNFSYPIARVIIDFGNVIMYYFINGMGLDAKSTFIGFSENASIHKIITESGSAETSYLITAVIFVFIFTVTLAIIAILLLIRIVALAILIIFASIAFVGSIVPFLSKYSSDWWDSIFKYSFFGPIMIFLLVVTSKMMDKTKDLQSAFETAAKSQSANDASLIGTIAFFLIPTVILWVGLSAAQKMSIAGAGAVVGRGQKFMGWAGRTMTGYRAAKWGGKTLAKKAERGLASGKHTWWMSPTAFKEAWKERTAEAERKAFKPAAGNWRDHLNSFFSRGKNVTRFREAAIQNNISQKEKEMQSVSTDFRYLYNEFKKAEGVKDTEKMAAALRIIASNNDLNDFMGEEGEVMNPFNVKKVLHNKLTKAGMHSNEAGKQLADIGEISFGKGNYQLFGMAKYNIQKEQYELNEDDDQMKLATGKASNIKAQTKTDLWHWNSFLNQNPDGTPGGLHEIGISQLENLSTSELGQMNRVRRDFVDKLSTRVNDIRAHADELDQQAKALKFTGDPRDAAQGDRLENQAKLIQKFADHVYGLKYTPGYKVS